MTKAGKEKIEFKAEVAQVLNLVVHSLYSNKEVFLRELISNASDAIDKHRHLTYTDDTYQKPEQPYAIRIAPDKKNKTLVIEDNGIGMNHDEAVQNLGTIASSGTRAFINELSKNKEKNVDLIGQFGVGFYSAFMVADRVEVETKRAGSDAPAIRWESDASGTYTIEEIERKDQGTKITLFLKPECENFLDEYEIETVVQKYSDYVAHPIFLAKEKVTEKKDKKDKADAPAELEEVQINKISAIWRRPKSEVTEEEYKEFYKYVSHDSEEPLIWSHHSMEGTMEYKMLLYIPRKAPFTFFREDIRGVRLHVKKMFITDDCKDFLPMYFRFVRGVIDSEDLPLNISRETLQHNALVPKIRKQVIKRIFEMLEDLEANRPEDFKLFSRELGVAIKEGIASDFENRDKLLKLVRFQSSEGKSAEDITSLKDYVARMKTDQKDIYYITGMSRAACEQSPHLELFKQKGIEVLYLVDPIDEWVAPQIGEYEGKKIVAINRGNLDLGDLGKEDKKKKEKADTEYKDFAQKIRAELQEKIKDVRMSVRLSESASCLVADVGDMDTNMEQIMKAMGKEVPFTKRILELNPNHESIKNMKAIFAKDASDARLATWAKILYAQALLGEGGKLENPKEFIHQIGSLLSEVTASTSEGKKA